MDHQRLSRRLRLTVTWFSLICSHVSSITDATMSRRSTRFRCISIGREKSASVCTTRSSRCISPARISTCRCAPPNSPFSPSQLPPQQFKMHHHRVDRVLHLVSDTRRHSPNRRQPPRHLQLLPSCNTDSLSRSVNSVPICPPVPTTSPIRSSESSPVVHPPAVTTLRAHITPLGERRQHRRPSAVSGAKISSTRVRPSARSTVPGNPLPSSDQKMLHRIRHHHRPQIAGRAS
jgi:hypothetical protein